MPNYINVFRTISTFLSHLVCHLVIIPSYKHKLHLLTLKPKLPALINNIAIHIIKLEFHINDLDGLLAI